MLQALLVNYFDGKLFGTIYLAMKRGAKYEDHCFHKVLYRCIILSAFFLGGRRGTRTPKHFLNLTGESKNLKMLEYPLNQLHTYYGCLCDLLSFM
jgi:hypothetical protein